MDYKYLIASRDGVVKYIACNLMPKGYIFYTTFMIPEDKDPELVDAKIILKYNTHLDKFTRARRKKGGVAAVKYVRWDRLGILLATKGESPFFTEEGDVRNASDNPLVIAGYSISVNPQTFKVSVRIHREAMKELKRLVMEWGFKKDRAWWDNWFKRGLPFLPFKGVQDGAYALLRLLNENRKSFKQNTLDWKDCIRRKFPVVPMLEPSSKELLDLLRCYKAPLKSTGEAEKE